MQDTTCNMNKYRQAPPQSSATPHTIKQVHLKAVSSISSHLKQQHGTHRIALKIVSLSVCCLYYLFNNCVKMFKKKQMIEGNVVIAVVATLALT